MDDNDMQKIRLFPNHTSFFDGSKYPEHMMIPVCVQDRPNANVILKPHYPKQIVYANNMDISMEEIRAQRYLLKRFFSFLTSYDLFVLFFFFLRHAT